MSRTSKDPKIDNLAVNGLTGIENSLAYKVNEIEKHFHNTPLYYGSDGAGSCTQDGLTVFSLSAGSGAYGQETQIHDGTVIEGGDATKKFDFHEMYITSVGTANRLTYIEFICTEQSAGVNLDGATNATNKLDLTGHSLNNGNKIMLSSTGNLPNGLFNYIVYYVVNKTVDDFQVSLTSGGAAVTFSDDGTGTHSYHTLTQSQCTIKPISFANINTDATEIMLMCARVTCDKRITMRGKANGGTNTVNFIWGVHSYVG
jgi:hypothetical protein